MTIRWRIRSTRGALSAASAAGLACRAVQTRWILTELNCSRPAYPYATVPSCWVSCRRHRLCVSDADTRSHCSRQLVATPLRGLPACTVDMFSPVVSLVSPHPDRLLIWVEAWPTTRTKGGLARNMNHRTRQDFFKKKPPGG